MKKWIFLIVVFSVIGYQAKGSYILLPMDSEKQRDHLKAYGLTYWVLTQEVETYWLLNYRGGSFAFAHTPRFESECKIRGISYEVIPNAKFVIWNCINLKG